MANGTIQTSPEINYPKFYNSPEDLTPTIGYIVRCTTADKTTVPATNKYIQPFFVRDANSKNFMWMEVIHMNTGAVRFSFNISGWVNGADVSKTPFGMTIDSSGNITYQIGDVAAFKSALGI